MNKTVRIVLYVLSILTVVGVIAALVLNGGKMPEKSAVAQSEITGRQEPQKQLEQNGQMQNEEQGAVQDDSEKTSDIQGADDVSEPNDAEQTTAGDTTLIFTGDVLFGNAFQAGYDAGGICGVLSEGLLQKLNEADILMINNEFPFSDRGAAVADKQYTFCCATQYVKALNEMGVDVVSLANNHTLDYGKEALSDTFQTLDGAGILYGGAGESIERAEQVQVIEVNGRKFGFLAVSRVIPSTDWKVENSLPGIFSCYDDTRLMELVQEAQSQVDFLVVFPHWGLEYHENPEAYQTSIAQKCMEAGADLVVGAHTHCLQGIEYIDGKPVFYSLGNFMFGQNIDRSMAVKVTVSEKGEASYQLLPVFAAGGVTQEMDVQKSGSLYSYVQQISPNALVDASGIVTEQKE